jgi:hypothetical protein
MGYARQPGVFGLERARIHIRALTPVFAGYVK